MSDQDQTSGEHSEELPQAAPLDYQAPEPSVVSSSGRAWIIGGCAFMGLIALLLFAAGGAIFFKALEFGPSAGDSYFLVAGLLLFGLGALLVYWTWEHLRLLISPRR